MMIKEKKTVTTEDELDKTRELPKLHMSKGVPVEELEAESEDLVSERATEFSLRNNLMLEQDDEVLSQGDKHKDDSEEDHLKEDETFSETAKPIEEASNIQEASSKDEEINESDDNQSHQATNKVPSSDAEENSSKESKESLEKQKIETEAEDEETTQKDEENHQYEIELASMKEEKTQEETTSDVKNKETENATEETNESIETKEEVQSKQDHTEEASKEEDDITEVRSLTLEEKRKQEMADKLTLEEKRAVDLNKKTLEDKRKEELEQAMTLEEKRKQALVDKMTIEEKRALQKKQGSVPSDLKKSFFDEAKELFIKPAKLDIVCIVLWIINVFSSVYIAMQINRYFSMLYAGVFFVMMLLILALVGYLIVKKRRVGLGVNVVVALFMIAATVVLMRISGFANQVFDNSESETVMIVAKKESTLTEASDFKDKKIAFVSSDEDTNAFAKDMLEEEQKTGYANTEYQTYKEAYDALQKDQVDMMVYTAYAKQRMEEEEIDSWSHVKVLLQKNREMKAVESKTVDITKDPFNVLISGVDLTSHGINEKGSSDVNIILSVNPKTKKMIMQTIPRDTWAPLTCRNGNHTKLTYAGAYGGIECSISTIEEMYDIEINYYAKINFKGVIDLVDALGGITVNSDVSFCESHPLDGYETRDYCYYAGENTIDGVEALMFSRIRKVFADGDIERGKHQMEVVNSVIRKFKEEPTLDHINGLLGAVQQNFTTNLNEDDIGKALTLFTQMGDLLNQIESYTMQGELVWKTDEVSNEYLYYFFPNDGEVEQFKKRIQDIIEGK